MTSRWSKPSWDRSGRSPPYRGLNRYGSSKRPLGRSVPPHRAQTARRGPQGVAAHRWRFKAGCNSRPGCPDGPVKMLVQVALIVFALCGLLSLVVDVGAARLTQGQMQNAADAAALEGLSMRDVGLRTPAGQFVNDPFASDCRRRAAANRMVRRTFDDDFEPANGDPYQFGAGPIVGLTDGTTTLHAGQTISVPEPRVYKPDPQLNQQNQVYGDMVSGRFCYRRSGSVGRRPVRSAGHRLHRRATRQRHVRE